MHAPYRLGEEGLETCKEWEQTLCSAGYAKQCEWQQGDIVRDVLARLARISTVPAKTNPLDSIIPHLDIITFLPTALLTSFTSTLTNFKIDSSASISHFALWFAPLLPSEESPSVSSPCYKVATNSQLFRLGSTCLHALKKTNTIQLHAPHKSPQISLRLFLPEYPSTSSTRI